jgi:two-component system, NtrC family, response regulator HydG
MARSILIVDDETEIAEFLAMGFEGYNFEATVANSVADAETKIIDKKFDIILSDIRMPNKDGIALLKWVRARDKVNPIMFMMTGYSMYSEEEMIKLGAAAVITKPLSLESLIEIINQFSPEAGT